MKATNLQTLARLRLLVGFLGEKNQYGWWPTSFFGALGEQFMAPVFTSSILLAQFHGATEAARKLHDQHIGVGRVFHLFRLPEEIEQDLHRLIQNEPQFISPDLFNKKEAAEAELKKIAEKDRSLSEGPVALGKASTLLKKESISTMAQIYAGAFQQGKRSYPYFTFQ